jgi:hypothetical protein
VKLYIANYLTDNRVTVDGFSDVELVDRLYAEMAEFSFLTKYIFGAGVEEINLNAWNDIEIQKSGSERIKLDENLTRLSMRSCGAPDASGIRMVIDNALPLRSAICQKHTDNDPQESACR